MKVAIYDNEMCNIKSVENSVLHLGFTPIITKDCDFTTEPNHLIIPGVGSFDTAMAKMKSNGAYENILNYIKKNNKVLGICLGMQLLFDLGNEKRECEGLGVIKGEVVSLPKPIKDLRENSPNMGWSEVNVKKQNQILNGLKDDDMVYLVHSYFCKPANNQIITLSTKFGNEDICIGVSENNIHGFQFHPEKSGNIGLNLIENFLKL